MAEDRTGQDSGLTPEQLNGMFGNHADYVLTRIKHALGQPSREICAMCDEGKVFVWGIDLRPEYEDCPNCNGSGYVLEA